MRARLWLLGALIIFLPLSAWLVSYSGNYLVSLGRDILLGLFLLSSLFTPSGVEGPNIKRWRKPNAIAWLSFGFIFFTLLSYITKQDSLAEWLRGVRYLIEPIILLAALQIDPLPTESLRPLANIFGISVVMVLVASVIDYFAPQFWRTTLHHGGLGFLGQIHLAANLPRLQATLAGPNALGLFLLIALLLTPVWVKNWPKWVSVSARILGLLTLLLTFSRSSYFGLLAGHIFFLTAGRKLIARWRVWLTAVILVAILAAGTALILKPAQLTRLDSNATRFEQYQRIWRERSQIGLTGRGAGTTGPFSDHSFDNQPTYFSENTYLDVYENIGPFGMLTYLAIWVWLIALLVKQKTLIAISAAAAAFGLAVAGIFIDHYTGQAALWVTILFAGVAVTRPNPENLPLAGAAS